MTADVPRIVVTGLDLVSPLGGGVDPVWPRLCAGASGVRALCDDLVPDVPAKVAGTVPTVADLDLAANTARQAPVRHVLSIGFGFGGVNASVLFGLV